MTLPHSRWLPLLLVLLFACATPTTPEGYYEARGEVRKNLRTAEGRSHARSVWRQTSSTFQGAAARCAAGHAPQRGVELYFRLDAEGKPVERVVYPDTKYAHCVHEGLGEVEFMPPPKPDHWIVLSAPYEG